MRQTGETSNWIAPFFTIWTGQSLSLVGSRIAQFALVWWLTETTGSATILATASMVALIPEILLAPFSGALTDRWQRRLVMIFADSLMALAALWLAFLFWTGSMQIWYVYVVMTLRAIGNSFHWPAMEASTGMMVPKSQLSRVQGVNQTMRGALNIIAPPLGALFLDLLPLHQVMMIDVGTAALAITPLLFIPVPQPVRSPHEANTTVWADMVSGFRYLVSWRGMMVIIGAVMLLKLALSPAFSLLPLLVSQHFRGGASDLSLLQAVNGVGVVLGGLVLSVWGGFNRRVFTMLAGIFALGLSILALGFIPSGFFWLALVSIFILGFMVPMVDGPFMAISQANVAPEMQGRVFGVMGSLLSITSPISLAVAGPISDGLGLQVWYIAAGIICILIGLVGARIPSIVNIERENNPTEGKVSKTPETSLKAKSQA
jgi:DHA3 family macrolide efflux protein-like MFS transporter